MYRYTIPFCMLIIAMAGVAEAQHMYVYPSKGQSQEKQQEDQWQCSQWATQQTGVDPKKVAQEATNPDTYAKKPNYGGAVVGSSAKGAALGAIGGAIAGNAGQGAAIGAAVAGLAGLFKARKQTQEQHTYNSNLAAYQKQQLAQFDAAYKTCLQGRGYTVN